jgi:hypothetical protein
MDHRDTNWDKEADSKSAHPLLRKEKAKRKPEDIYIFMDAVGFYEDDLEANQAGYISKEQYRLLYSRRNSWFVGIIILLWVLAILWFGWRNTFLIVMFLGGLFYSITKLIRIHRDLRSREAISVEGRIALDVNGRLFTLTLGHMQFNLDKTAFLAFKNGDPYRIFYTPYSKQILSAEWLRD